MCCQFKGKTTWKSNLGSTQKGLETSTDDTEAMDREKVLPKLLLFQK